MSNNLNFVEWFTTIQRLRNIKRCQLFFCNWPESVAEHSFFCSILAFIVANQLMLSFEESTEVALKALVHDLHEADVGDIPWFVEDKVSRILPQFYNSQSKDIVSSFDLTELGNKIVEFVDKAELFLNLYREYLAANDNIWEIMDNCMKLVEELAVDELKASSVVRDILALVNIVKLNFGAGSD